MSQRVFHSRVYGAMNKHKRRELGLAGYSREEVWRRMAAEERRLREALRRSRLTWWQRLALWLIGLVRRVGRIGRARRCPR